MNLKNKRVLVIGFGISGLSTIKALYQLGANISITDTKDESEFKEMLGSISHIPCEKYFNVDDLTFFDYDIIIKSPGIPPTAKLIQKAVESNIEVIGDIELAYRISPTKNIIAITGTNGKTTTTTLVGEIMKKNNKTTYLAGNIGIGILENIIHAKAEDVFVVEASSFQLEHTKFFKPKVSLILNISPDHINWHGSYINYINSKLKIFANQDYHDYLVLNYDDEILRKIEAKTNIIWFSTKSKLESGIYLDGNNIIIKYGDYNLEFMDYRDFKIKGMHNLENVLGSIGISLAMGLDLKLVMEAILDFKGVEHRLEYVCSFKDVAFYNDSKGTNPESTIKAIESFEKDIILIAGGYNKDSDFHKLFHNFKGKVKALILLGETKEAIKRVAIENNYNHIYLVHNMDEAVDLAYKLSEKGDNILLSPACASWDMYKNFEERGLHFKTIVNRLKEAYYGEIKKE